MSGEWERREDEEEVKARIRQEIGTEQGKNRAADYFVLMNCSFQCNRRR